MPRLFVATTEAGLYRSDDLGSSWTREPGLPSAARLYSLCATPGELLVGGHGRVYRYAERGWRELELPDEAASVWALTAMDGAIVVGTRPLGLLRSEDGGQSWERLDFALPPETPQPHTARVTALLPNPAVAREMWAAVEVGGVFATADGGRSWHAANDGLPSLDVHGLVWSSGGILAAATPRGVAIWRSARWVAGVFEPADRYCRALVGSPDDPSTLYCGFGDGPPGSRGGVAVSRDGGRSWHGSTFLPDAGSTVWSVATAMDAPALVLACSLAGKVFVSRDAAATWQAVFSADAEARAVACLCE